MNLRFVQFVELAFFNIFTEPEEKAITEEGTTEVKGAASEENDTEKE